MKRLLILIATSMMLTAVNANPLTEFPKNGQEANYLASCSAHINEFLVVDRKLGTGVVGSRTSKNALENVFAFGFTSIAFSDQNAYLSNYEKALSNIKNKEQEYLYGGAANVGKYTDYLSQNVMKCVPASKKILESKENELTRFMQVMKKEENNSLLKSMQETVKRTNQAHTN